MRSPAVEWGLAVDTWCRMASLRQQTACEWLPWSRPDLQASESLSPLAAPSWTACIQSAITMQRRNIFCWGKSNAVRTRTLQLNWEQASLLLRRDRVILSGRITHRLASNCPDSHSDSTECIAYKFYNTPLQGRTLLPCSHRRARVGVYLPYLFWESSSWTSCHSRRHRLRWEEALWPPAFVQMRNTQVANTRPWKCLSSKEQNMQELLPQKGKGSCLFKLEKIW